MAWAILIGSGVFEAVWATALGMSEGFTRPVPVLVFALAMLVSVAGLAHAMKSIPTGTAYAVWTGVGSVLTVAIATTTGAESLTVAKVLLLAGIIGCVIGLKLLPDSTE